MKKKQVVACCVLCLLTVMFVIIGLTHPASLPVTQKPSQPPVSTTPTTPTPQLNVPSGTYYYVMGTHIAYYFQDVHLQDIQSFSPYIHFDDNEYEMHGTFGVQRGTAYSDNDNIIFDDALAIQQLMPIDTQHDDVWHALFYPKQELAWQCTYDSDTQTITIAHNSDFIQFRYFATTAEYVDYIKLNFAIGDGYEIYPKPTNDTLVLPDSEENTNE